MSEPLPKFSVGDVVEKIDGGGSFEVIRVLWVEPEQEYFYIQGGPGSVGIAHIERVLRRRSDA
jgi:hypothetical protein